MAEATDTLLQRRRAALLMMLMLFAQIRIKLKKEIVEVITSLYIACAVRECSVESRRLPNLQPCNFDRCLHVYCCAAMFTTL